MHPIIANQKHTPIHQLTTIITLATLDTLVMLDIKIHTKDQPTITDHTLLLHPTVDIRIHMLDMVEILMVGMATHMQTHMVDIVAHMVAHMVDHMVDHIIHTEIHMVTITLHPQEEAAAIQELKNWTILNQLLSTKSTLVKVIKSLPTRKLIQSNFPTEVFWKELELNLWIISSTPLLVEVMLSLATLENVSMNAVKESGNKNVAHPLLCIEKEIN